MRANLSVFDIHRIFDFVSKNFQEFDARSGKLICLAFSMQSERHIRPDECMGIDFSRIIIDQDSVWSGTWTPEQLMVYELYWGRIKCFIVK